MQRASESAVPAGRGPVTIVGGGSIGVSWAIVFARGRHPVRLYDADPDRLPAASLELVAKLEELAAAELLDEPVAAISARVQTSEGLEAALVDAVHVQECVPEHLEVKHAVLSRIESWTPEDCVLASSSSALMPSQIFGELRARARGLVVHPANPPHLLPIVELVPAPFTAPDVIDRTELMLSAIGMSPVRVHDEVEGFVYNRLQGAVLREAYALVRDGVIDVDGVDRIMREGLGRRWAVVGPFETSDLNTRGGLAVHAERMGPAYARMGQERGQNDPWTPELVEDVVAQRRAILPLERWEERVNWRDRQLIAQERARRASIAH